MNFRRVSRSILLLLLVGFVGSSGLVARANEYYVSPTGRDGGSGSKADPFRTVQRGVSRAVRPGDAVVLMAGVYQPIGTINLSRPGSVDQPITLKSAAGVEAIVDGSRTPAGANLIAVGTHYVRIEGLTIRNSHGNGIAIWGPGSRVHDVSVVGNSIHDCQQSGAYAGNRNLDDPVRDIVFENNTVTRASLKNESRRGNEGWSFALGAGLSRGVILRDNSVSSSYGEGIGLYLSDEGQIEGNTIRDCFSVNLYLDNTTNTHVARNFVHSTHDAEYYRFNMPAMGVSIANENYGGLANRCSHNVIVNNVLVGNRCAVYIANYQAGGGFRNSVFAHNTCVDATNRLLHIDSDPGHADSLIANNIFRQTSPQPLTDVEPPLSGITFRGNVWSGGAKHPQVQSTSDVDATPRFLTPTGKTEADFALAVDSEIAIQVGRIAEVGRDWNKRPRGQMTTPGAFE